MLRPHEKCISFVKIRVHSCSFVAQMVLICVHQRKSAAKRVLVVAPLRCVGPLRTIQQGSAAEQQEHYGDPSADGDAP